MSFLARRFCPDYRSARGFIWNARCASKVVSEHAYVELDMDKKDEKRAQDKQEGHSLPPNATENPMDDTDRNTDKVIDPSQQIPAVE
jgi:hypothetical protein